MDATPRVRAWKQCKSRLDVERVRFGFLVHSLFSYLIPKDDCADGLILLLPSMSQLDLQTKLRELQDRVKETAQLIITLSRSKPGKDESPDDAADLAADIQESLQQEERDLELVKQDVEELLDASLARDSQLGSRVTERAQEQMRINEICHRLTEDLRTLRTRFRKARLQAKKNAELAIQKEQEDYMIELQKAAYTSNHPEQASPTDKNMSPSEQRAHLFAGRRGPSRANGNQSKDELLLTASSDLTASLRRTHDLIKDQLSQSRFAQETLEESNAALKELNTRYGALDDLLSKSRGLLGSLLRSQKSDTWYLETSMRILIGVIGWLLFRRLLYGPLWWFVLYPLKFGWFVIASIVRSGTGKPLNVPKPAFQSGMTPLIVRPSASGWGLPRIPGFRGSVAAGAGDASAKQPTHAPDSRYTMSEEVRRIIESTQTLYDTSGIATATIAPDQAGNTGSTDNNKAGEEQGQNGGGEGQRRQGDAGAEVRRGDGSVLRERNEAAEPKNPKKRIMEEPPTKQQKKDEL